MKRNIPIVFFALCTAGLISCQESGPGEVVGSAPSSLARVLGPALVDDCPQGGVELEYGIDINSSGELDDVEVTGSYSICHGEAGASGESCTSVDVGDGQFEIQCPGQDAIVLSNGVPGEKGDTGDQGEKGEPGTDGLNGIDGQDGTDGLSGLEALVVTAEEPAGDNCAAGGVRLNSGLDADLSGALEATEVTQTAYVCNGAIGADGKDGAPGVDGKDGNDGAPGVDGKDGNDGAPGNDGKDGNDGAPGNDGKEGKPGPTGSKGDSCTLVPSKDGTQILCEDGTKALVIDGAPGQDGNSCTTVLVKGGAEIQCEDGTKALVKDGAKGEDGTNGDTGSAASSTLLTVTHATDTAKCSGKSRLVQFGVDGGAGGGVAGDGTLQAGEVTQSLEFCSTYIDEVSQVKDITPGIESSSPVHLTNVNGTLYFTVASQLWKSDGTWDGTVLVKDINPGGDSNFDHLTAFGSTLFFTADDGVNGSELWKSDGTEAGTMMVKDIRSGSQGSDPDDFTYAGTRFYFSADNGSNGNELWTSDGTTVGTVMVRDIWPGQGDSHPSSLTPYGTSDSIYFGANNGVNGYEIWRSDGTEAGTYMTIDTVQGYSSFMFSRLIYVGSKLYMRGYLQNSGGTELYRYTGSSVTKPIRVKDINPGNASSNPGYFINVGSTLYFRATDGTNGLELWKSNGYSSGTVMVKDINPTGSSLTTNAVVIGSTLYFRATDGTTGHELWKSDGTAAGTVMVKDINPGGNSTPSHLIDVGGTLYFIADDGTYGKELWKSDGTAAGTVLVKNIAPGTGSSSPSNLTNVDGTLYFEADDGTSGKELFKMSLIKGPLTLVD
jgi:ELWxxDGT repeat protein